MSKNTKKRYNPTAIYMIKVAILQDDFKRAIDIAELNKISPKKFAQIAREVSE